MAGTVWMVSGSKGGVGKSIVSMALSHYLLKRDDDILLVEADAANPDVVKAYGKTVETVYLNLDEKEGWIDLANQLAVNPRRSAEINTPARSGEGVRLYGTLLAETLSEMERELVTLWVINSQRDRLLLIVKTIPNPRTPSPKATRIGNLLDYIEGQTEQKVELRFAIGDFLTGSSQGQRAEMIALASETRRSNDPIDHWLLSWKAGEQPSETECRETVAILKHHLGMSSRASHRIGEAFAPLYSQITANGEA